MDDGDTPGTTVGPSTEAMEVARLSVGHFCVLAGIGTLQEMMEDRAPAPPPTPDSRPAAMSSRMSRP